MALLRILQKHGVKIAVLFLIFGGLSYLVFSPTKYQGYAPDQPIPFSHKVHAGELAIDCQFCHTTVEKSPHASVPDTATCMKCHQHVAGDSPHIQYLRETYEKGIPIRWHKVHDLPDHARFSHKPHIAAGFDCQQCHGDVASMEKVEVVAEFNMGWCVNCHRENYMKVDPPTQPVPAELGNNTTVKITECGTCHF